MPRKTDANDPADWLWISEQDLQVLRLVNDTGSIPTRESLLARSNDSGDQGKRVRSSCIETR